MVPGATSLPWVSMNFPAPPGPGTGIWQFITDTAVWAKAGRIVSVATRERIALAVAEGAQLPFGHERVRVLPTPGHTAACLSFVWRDRVFCGGLLAVDACPHQPHPADPAALWDSITLRLFTLPDETLLFAGHEQRARAVSTVLEQRRWHPFFARQTRDAFLARVAALPTQAADAVSAAAGHNTQSA